MGNGHSEARSSGRLAQTEAVLATVSRQRVEDLWSVCANDRLFITSQEAVCFLETLLQSLGVTLERDAIARLVAPLGGQVSHEDLHNLLFLAQDELEEADVAISDSLHRNFARLELPVRLVDLEQLRRTELLHSAAGIETWRAQWRADGREALLRVHALAFLRRDVDVHAVVEQMRKLHCQIALRYVGHAMDKDALVTVYEDPGSVCLLSSLLAGGRWQVLPASVRKMFLRFAKGLLWLDARKDFRHLQLRPDTVFVSTAGSTKLWCFVGEHLLKKRYDMVNVELLGSVVAYCAPETLRGDNFDASPADVFALGLLLYATLTGREPFAGMEATDVMELVLRGGRPPLEGLGELESVVEAAWRHDPHERATLEQLLEMLRRPLRSLRAGASMAMLPRRLSRKSSERQLPPAIISPPTVRNMLVASSPVVPVHSDLNASVPIVSRLVPPLRHVPIPIVGATGGGSSGMSSKPRSSSLSSSSYSESPEQSSATPRSKSQALAGPSGPPYLFNGGTMPHVKGSKIESAPSEELWYGLRLPAGSRLQFRVYPVLTAFEMRSLRQHWTKLWSLRGTPGVLSFEGAVTRPFIAELWAMGTRLELTETAARPAFFLVELCASMASSLHSLHQQKVNSLGSLGLSSFLLERGDEAAARLMLAPVVFKRSSRDAGPLPPEVLLGEPWSAAADNFVLGTLIEQLAKANTDLQLPRNRIFLRLLQHCVLEACAPDPVKRADAARVAHIIESAIR